MPDATPPPPRSTHRRRSAPAPSSAQPTGAASAPGARYPAGARAGATQSPATGAGPLALPPAEALTPEQRERGRMIGLAAVGLAAVVAIVVTGGIFLPAMGSLTPGGIRPVAARDLPGQLVVCEREYARSGATIETLQQVRARGGGEPVVVGTRGGCPEGVCIAGGVCQSLVFVATTDGGYAAYELRGEIDAAS